MEGSRINWMLGGNPFRVNAPSSIQLERREEGRGQERRRREESSGEKGEKRIKQTAGGSEIIEMITIKKSLKKRNGLANKLMAYEKYGNIRKENQHLLCKSRLNHPSEI